MEDTDKQVNKRMEGKTGRLCMFRLSLPILLLDDLLLGPSKEVMIELEYADGTKKTLVANERGEIPVLPNHGTYVDIRELGESFLPARRVFITPGKSQSEASAWQRLVNLGYVVQPQPPESPPDAESLALALEEFQAENDMEPTGELDAETFNLLLEFYDAGTDLETKHPESEPGAEEDAEGVEFPKGEMT